MRFYFVMNDESNSERSNYRNDVRHAIRNSHQCAGVIRSQVDMIGLNKLYNVFDLFNIFSIIILNKELVPEIRDRFRHSIRQQSSANRLQEPADGPSHSPDR